MSTRIRRNRSTIAIGAGVVLILFVLGAMWALEKAPSSRATGPAKTKSISAEHPEWTLLIEEAFADLKPAVIAFNAPETLEFDKTSSIELLLSLTDPIEEVQKRLTAIGKQEGFEIRASSQMEASLRAARDSAFKVVAVTPEIQNLRVKEDTRWAWRVTPLEWGPQELELTVSAIYSVDGRDGKRALRTFQHIIVVHVTYWQRAKVFTKNNWQWLWTAFVVPIAGWLWVRRCRKTGSVLPEDA